MWDLGGQVSLRLSWAAYYASTDAVIVVIDSTDRARMGIARQELANILASPQLAGACILVFANKQARGGGGMRRWWSPGGDDPCAAVLPHCGLSAKN